MNLITRTAQIAARGLKALAPLLQTYRTEAEVASTWHLQIVNDFTRRVLESTEIRNAVAYAKIDPNTLLARAINQSEKLLIIENSSMDELTMYGRGSYSVLKAAIYRTLMKHPSHVPEKADPNSGSQNPPPPISKDNTGIITIKDIGEAFEDLTPSIALPLVLLIAVPFLLLLAINSVSLILGNYGILYLDVLLITVAALTVSLAAQGCVKWTVAEKNVDKLMRTIIAPFVREQVNIELRRAHLENSFHITVAPGLIELSDREQLVETATMRRLRMLLNTMTFGSIGVSGARGTGKSVLLRAFCDERLGRPEVPELSILVSAPVDYDGRDFILHLFSTLCLKLIDIAGTSQKVSAVRRLIVTLCQIGVIVGGCLIAAEAGVKLSRAQIGLVERVLLASIVLTVALAIVARFTGVRFISVRYISRPQHQTVATKDIGPTSDSYTRDRGIALLITAVALIIMVIGAATFINSKFYVSLHSFIQVFHETKRFWPGAIVLVSALCVGIASSLISRRRRVRRPQDITDQAHEYLRRIESIRTVTTGQSAAIGLWGSRIQLNRSRASQLAERDLTLPAIVDLYRGFTTNVVAWWKARHGGLGRVLIGIDELDKITNTESAERFLNEIKAVFGIPNCLYIISASEDALLQFEQKSLGFRSVFDSAFDDIIRVDTFSPTDTHELLLRRLAGIGDPFIVLCHVFSAGLSRDVLRTARAIIEARCNGLVNLKEICQFLMSREIADLKKGLRAAHASWSVSENRQTLESELVDALMDDRWPGTNSQELLSAATPSLRAGTPEMYTALCLLATVYDLAVNENNKTWADYFVPGTMQDAIDDLAGARSWLSGDPDAAMGLVRAARDKLDLRPVE